jgi:hypothetical protein
MQLSVNCCEIDPRTSPILFGPSNQAHARTRSVASELALSQTPRPNLLSPSLPPSLHPSIPPSLSPPSNPRRNLPLVKCVRMPVECECLALRARVRCERLAATHRELDRSEALHRHEDASVLSMLAG